MHLRLTKPLLILMLAGSALLAQAQNIANLLQKAQAGDPKAQFDLASAYMAGNGVAVSPTQGMEWLRKSAEQGYASAQATLGYFYEKGGLRSVPGFEQPNPHEAAKWFRKAAQQYEKDPSPARHAQNDLSQMLAQGLISKQEADWHVAESGAQHVTAKDAKKGPRPFSLAEVETGLTGGITSKRMATLVTTYGVDFSLNANARKRLTDDGADDDLLAAISTSRH